MLERLSGVGGDGHPGAGGAECSGHPRAAPHLAANLDSHGHLDSNCNFDTDSDSYSTTHCYIHPHRGGEP